MNCPGKAARRSNFERPRAIRIAAIEQIQPRVAIRLVISLETASVGSGSGINGCTRILVENCAKESCTA